MPGKQRRPFIRDMTLSAKAIFTLYLIQFFHLRFFTGMPGERRMLWTLIR